MTESSIEAKRDGIAAARPKVGRELAEAEFARWVEAMGLGRKLDRSRMSDEDKAGVSIVRDVLLDAMQAGSLVVDPEGRFVFTPVMGDHGPVTFYEPTGASMLAMDQAKPGAGVARQMKFMADMTKTNQAVFAKMKARDLGVCDAITTLFLVR